MQIHRTPTASIATSLVTLLVAVVTPAMAQPSSDLDDYAVFADENISARGLTVLGGDVGVNHGPLTSTRSLDAPHSNVVADRVDLDPASRCNALFASSGQAAPACGPPTSFVGPLVADLASACGVPDDEVSCDPSRPIPVGHDVVDADHAAGSYGKVEISGGGRGPGTLKLGPGRYVFCSLDVARHGRLEVDGNTEIVVTGSVWIDNGATIGRNPGGTALADLVRLFVTGDRVRISRRAAVQALLCAPRAQLTMRQGAVLIGRFAARDIRSDRVFVTGVGGVPSTSSSTTVPTTSSSSTVPTTTTVRPTTSTTSSTSSTLAPATTSTTTASSSTTSSSTTAAPSTTVPTSSSTTSTASTTSSTTTSAVPATTTTTAAPSTTTSTTAVPITTTTAAPSTTTSTTAVPITTTTAAPSTTTSTSVSPTTSTSSTTSTTLGSVTCGPGGIAIDLSVPYDEVGAPQLSGVRMNVDYTAAVSMPNIPGTSFADPSRLLDLSGKGPFLLGQDTDTNADTIEDHLSIVFSLTNQVFAPGSIVRATFDCNAGMVSASAFTCALDQASDIVGNDVANPAAIPCRVVAIAPAP